MNFPQSTPMSVMQSEAGLVGFNRVAHADGSVEELDHIAQIEMQVDDVFEIRTPGGGGLGPATEVL